MERVVLPFQSALVVAGVVFFCGSCFHLCAGQSRIPVKYDGFLYKGVPSRIEDSILVEAFFDPLCPDSRDAWLPLKQALEHYAPRISLIVHPFPLPYHDNAFVACRALHIANMLNQSTTYPLLELFFKHQAKFYNKPTHKMSRALIVKHMEKLAVDAIGNSSMPVFENGFEDPKTDRAARTSFNYGCSRGVTGTPFFFVNGFPLPGAGSAIAYSKWKSILDSLLSEHTEMAEEFLEFSF